MASFAPEPILHIGTFPITNTIISTIFVDTIIIGFVLYIRKQLLPIPRVIQNSTELIIDTFYKLTESVSRNKAQQIFPFFMSFFVFILVANWSALIPGVGTIGFFHNEEGHRVLIPIFRGITTDVNTTLALALVSAIATHLLSISTLGIKEYVARYFSLNPINLFVGVLEIVSEITKVVSLSFRLFGNIFAGEVVLLTVSSIFAFLLPLPFLMLEIVVGLVQALVFSMLTMSFMAILTTPHNVSKEVNH